MIQIIQLFFWAFGGFAASRGAGRMVVFFGGEEEKVYLCGVK